MKIRNSVLKGLSGVGNKAYHQYIISDLIYSVRKKFVKERIATRYAVLSEISLSQIGYETTRDNFRKDYNIDFVVIDEESKNLLFLAEIERDGVTITSTLKKIEECLRKIPTIKEAYIIKFDGVGNITFELCTIDEGKFRCVVVSSKSKFLGFSLRNSFVSTRNR